MILAVDIGNTNIKVAGWDNENLAFLSSMHTSQHRTCDEYAVKLLDIFRLGQFNITQFDGAIISSVVPQISETMERAIKKVIQTDRVLLVSPGLKTGLNIKIDDPATLGADLVCAGVAAVANYPLPCIIVSLGTATALFAINDKAEFLGGVVAPGVQVSIDALSTMAAQLPHISLSDPGPLIGRNTIESMRAGAVYGSAAMLDGIISKLKKELGGDATVVATGGMTSLIVPYCEQEIIINNELILQGLNIIYHKNI